MEIALEGPYALTAGPDGALWVTLPERGAVARVELDGTVTHHDVGPRPLQIVAGPDGALWFTAQDRIGRLSLAGELSAVPAVEPYGIAVGPDRAIWYTGSDHVGRVGGDRFAVTGFPAMICAGPDEAMWFTLNAASAIGRIDMRGNLSVRELPTPQAGPVGIAATHEAVWFTEILAGQLGRIPMDDAIQELPLPDRECKPHAVIAAQADGVWVSLWGSAELAHVSFDGELAILPLPPASEPHGMAVSHDGALWVALESANALLRVEG